MERTQKITDIESKELTRWVLYLADWELFTTATFKRRHGLWQTAAAYESFMDRNFPQVTHFYAVEENPSGDGGHHIHSMWAGTCDLWRKAAWKIAFAQMGRTRIEPIHKEQKVRDYCTKYVCKEGSLWWFRINDNELFNRHRKQPERAA